MSKIKSFIKVSGDEFRNPKFHEWVSRDLYGKTRVVICVGGRTDINEEFSRRGFPVEKRGPTGREPETFEQKQVQRDILERNANELTNIFVEQGMYVSVIIPFLDIGGELCPVDGDDMVRNAYIEYDHLYVITSTERRKEKEDKFAYLMPKVKVIAFDW